MKSTVLFLLLNTSNAHDGHYDGYYEPSYSVQPTASYSMAPTSSYNVVQPMPNNYSTANPYQYGTARWQEWESERGYYSQLVVPDTPMVSANMANVGQTLPLDAASPNWGSFSFSAGVYDGMNTQNSWAGLPNKIDNTYSLSSAEIGQEGNPSWRTTDLTNPYKKGTQDYQEWNILNQYNQYLYTSNNRNYGRPVNKKTVRVP